MYVYIYIPNYIYIYIYIYTPKFCIYTKNYRIGLMTIGAEYT